MRVSNAQFGLSLHSPTTSIAFEKKIKKLGEKTIEKALA